ncbi:hypothetical protein Tco_1073096 [Tanacetum coccineum]
MAQSMNSLDTHHLRKKRKKRRNEEGKRKNEEKEELRNEGDQSKASGMGSTTESSGYASMLNEWMSDLESRCKGVNPMW